EGGRAWEEGGEGGGGMVMARGRLSRQDDLHPGEERGRDRVGAAEPGIAQDENATLGLIERHEPRGLEQRLAHLLPAPAIRNRLRHALLRQQHVEGGPQGREGEPIEPRRILGGQVRVTRRHGGIHREPASPSEPFGRSTSRTSATLSAAAWTSWSRVGLCWKRGSET